MNKPKQHQVVPDAVRVTRWDTADYLEDLDDIVYYLEAAFDDSDPHLITEALGNVARAKGMTAIAAETGLGRESLYKALSSSGNPKLTTIIGVLRAIGIRLQPTALISSSQKNHGPVSGSANGLIRQSRSDSTSIVTYNVTIER